MFCCAAFVSAFPVNVMTPKKPSAPAHICLMYFITSKCSNFFGRGNRRKCYNDHEITSVSIYMNETLIYATVFAFALGVGVGFFLRGALG